MTEKKKIITPGDPEFANALHEHAPSAFKKFMEKNPKGSVDPDIFKDMDHDSDPIVVQFTQREYPHFHLEYGIQELSSTWSKIAFHFKKISKHNMAIVGEYLAKCTIEMNLPNVEAEASENPMLRNHWDLIIYTTAFEAPFIMDRFLMFIDRLQTIINGQ